MATPLKGLNIDTEPFSKGEKTKGFFFYRRKSGGKKLNEKLSEFLVRGRPSKPTKKLAPRSTEYCAKAIVKNTE